MAITVEEYRKALDSFAEILKLHEQITDPALKKAVRDGCIQRYEFCVELAWKVAGKIMGSTSTAANTIVREMARDGLINDPEVWFNFIKFRNLSSHTYNDERAAAVFAVAETFLAVGSDLLRQLMAR